MSTLAQFRTAISSEVGLDNSTTGDQTNIDKWVNEAVVDFVRRSSCQMASATMTLTAGTADYTLDTSILTIYDAYVTTSGTPYWMEVATVDDILAMRRTTTANVSPAQFYAVGGSDLFMIYPTPATADTVNIYYIPRPATLSVSSDTPSSIPAEFHPAVEYYALYRAASFSDDASSQMGQSYLQRYEMLVKQYKRDVMTTANHRLPRASVRRNRASIPFHDRSRYPQ